MMLGVAVAEPVESPPARQAEAESARGENRLSPEELRRADPTGRATAILSTRVLDSGGELAATIADILLDLPAARLGPVIVTPAGSLETPGELGAVPASALERLPSGEFRLAVDRDAFAAAPRFQADQWPDLRDDTYLGSLYRAYRVEPYFRSDAWQDGTTGNLELGVTGNTRGDEVVEAGESPPGKRAGPATRVTRIIGLPVRDTDGDRLGKIEDVLVDFPAERIVALAVAVDGLAGGESRTALVAPAAFSLPASGDELRLDMSRDGLAGAPRLRGEEPQASTRSSAARAIREALAGTPSLDVTEEADRIIVAGTVSSEEEKERILEIARRHAGDSSVENQMIVERPPGAASE